MVTNWREEFKSIIDSAPPFFFETSNDFAIEFMEYLDETERSYYWISDWGAIPEYRDFGEVYSYIIETTEEKAYISSSEYLEQSDDKVFARIMKPGRKKQKLPNFEDVFETVKL